MVVVGFSGSKVSQSVSQSVSPHTHTHTHTHTHIPLKFPFLDVHVLVTSGSKFPFHCTVHGTPYTHPSPLTCIPRTALLLQDFSQEQVLSLSLSLFSNSIPRTLLSMRIRTATVPNWTTQAAGRGRDFRTYPICDHHICPTFLPFMGCTDNLPFSLPPCTTTSSPPQIFI